MAYKVIFGIRFSKKVVSVSKYLEKKWSIKVAKEFLALVDEKILAISQNPEIGLPAKKDVRKVVVTKHNIIYYRLKGRAIYLVCFFETKQHPQKNKYE